MIDTVIKTALLKRISVFVKTDKPGKSGYIIGLEKSKGYKIRGSGYDKPFYVTVDESYTVEQDCDRLYVSHSILF